MQQTTLLPGTATEIKTRIDEREEQGAPDVTGGAGSSEATQKRQGMAS